MAEKLVQIGDLRPDSGSSRRGSHRLGSWNECPQAWAYRFMLHLIPVREPPGRALGALVHLGLMYWHLLMLQRTDLDPIEVMRSASPRIAHRFNDARAIVEAYKNWGWPSGWRVLDVEREFEVRAGGHAHTQRMDLVIAVDGYACVVDHKTTGGNPHTYPREWNTSLQFLSADTIGRAVFPDVYDLPYGGTWIQAIGTKEPGEFHRHRLSPEPEMLRSQPKTWLG